MHFQMLCEGLLWAISGNWREISYQMTSLKSRASLGSSIRANLDNGRKKVFIELINTMQAETQHRSESILLCA